MLVGILGEGGSREAEFETYDYNSSMIIILDMTNRKKRWGEGEEKKIVYALI